MADGDVDEFTPEGYGRLLSSLGDQGYSVCDFSEVDPSSPNLILRHDLDMSMKAAMPVAEVEAALGLAATYFVLIRSEIYNPFSASGGDVLRQLVELGHRVGLHFDASLYEDDSGAQETAARQECAVLEAMIGAPVTVISYHRPFPSVLGRPGSFASRRNAYEKAFFTDIGYCSDSRGAWHYGHPLDHPAVARRQALQLLTHPMWWAPGAVSARAKLQAVVDAHIADMEAAVSATLAPAGIPA